GTPPPEREPYKYLGHVVVDSIFDHWKNVQDDALAPLLEGFHLSHHLETNLITTSSTWWESLALQESHFVRDAVFRVEDLVNATYRNASSRLVNLAVRHRHSAFALPCRAGSLRKKSWTVANAMPRCVPLFSTFLQDRFDRASEHDPEVLVQREIPLGF